MLDLYTKIADYGITGAIIVVQFFFIWRQEKRLEAMTRSFKAECQARVEDAKSYTDMALELNERVTRALNHLGDLLGSEENGASHYREEREP